MKKLIIIVVCIIVSNLSYAQDTSKWQVTPQNAQIKAESFFSKKGISMKKRMMSRTATFDVGMGIDSIAPYYIFNAGSNQGFVIISGDSRVDDIIGYSDSGDFDVDSIPENMQEWLNGYRDAIKYIWYNNVPLSYFSLSSSLKNKSAIYPIVTTQWSQSKPYNGMAPLYKGSSCLTGCVATAMAQVMNHARWPKSSTTPIPSYKTNNQLGELAGLPSTIFDWDVIAQENGSYYETEVAKLMRYCGQSVKMNYGTGASAASSYSVAPAFINYFGYSSAKMINRESYSISEWDEMIYNEIANNRAVYYDGQSTGGGHAFVVDGYDGNGLFHINWGWGGYCDGYFKLSILNPYSNSGYGASSSDDGYSMSQNAVIGLCSGNDLLEEVLRCTSLSCNDASLYISYYNESHNSLSCSYGVAIMDDNGKLELIGNPSSKIFEPKQTENVTFNVSTYLTKPGTYSMVPVYRKSSTDSWKRTADYKKYATITLSSDLSLDITIHPIKQLSLEGLTVDGDKKLGSEQVLKFSVKNTGDDYLGTVYCFVSSTVDKGKYISRAGLAVEGGAIETVDIYITPPEAGKLNVWLTSDYSGNDVIGYATISITSDQTESSLLSMTYINVETGSGFAKTTFYLHNDGQFAYGRPIYVELTDVVTNEVEQSYTLNDISIKPERTNGWWVRFLALDNSKIYYFNIYYYAEASGSEKKLAGKVKIVMPEASVNTTHNLSISVSKGGNVNYNSLTISNNTSSYEVVDGSDVILNISEQEGYYLKAMEVNGINVTSEVSDGSYTISNVKTDQTVIVTFVPQPTITIRQTEKGVAKIVVKYAQARTFKIVPNNEKELSYVKFNGIDVTKQVTSDYFYTTPIITDDSTLEVVYSNIIGEYVHGDANNDGFVNVADIVAITNYRKGAAPAGFNAKAADLNNDSNVDETDISILDKMIMGK